MRWFHRSLFLVAFALTACCNDDSCRFNDSSAQDRFLGSSSSADPHASASFPAAQAVFRNNCVQCHAAFGSYTEAQWISASYIVPGQPSQSLVFQKTRGSATGGPENMPPGQTLSSNELQAIRLWITNLSTGGGVPSPTNSGADQRFQAALGVLSKASLATGKSCMTCHAATTTSVFYSGQTVPAFANFTREADFVTSQLVVSGLTANSWLYRSLRGHGGDIASMPKGDSTSISDPDAAVLDAWISQIGN